MSSSNGTFGIPYAHVDFDNVLPGDPGAIEDPDEPGSFYVVVHVCPECEERIREDVDSTGEFRTANYAKHYDEQHRPEAG